MMLQIHDDEGTGMMLLIHDDEGTDVAVSS